MPRKSQSPEERSADVQAYQHTGATRKNIATAGQAAEGKIREVPKQVYAYDPHRPPILRFDPTGAADRLPELLEIAQNRALTVEETRILADALKNQQPWLEWAGKQEAKSFAVDPVALNIHERVSTQAILRVAARQDVQRSLFADPEQEYHEAVQFYQHDIDWSNRLILGDSLHVMASLSHREALAGKVQCIYMDPPYGIKYASNFQSQVGKRDVKDKPEDLTREPEQIKAYRDTWNLGVHSYLTYLRDRLTVAKELLTDSGSIFVQISDENLHRVRAVMDEVFEAENFVSLVTVRKTGAVSSPDARLNALGTISDYILWYAKRKESLKYRQLYSGKEETNTADQYRLTDESGNYQSVTVESNGYSETFHFPVRLFGKSYLPTSTRHWSTTEQGIYRVALADRVISTEKKLRFKKYLADFTVSPIANIWADVMGSSGLMYVVQTNERIVERCILMTTDPGDLVLDPTCGSGTTAYVAEQWGRRWITIDSSRVALAIARQRLLTAKFDYYRLKEEKQGIGGGLVYKTVPHITLKSIAQNMALDPIFEEWEPVLAEKLAELNAALPLVTPQLRAVLLQKLEMKRRKRDKTDPLTDADTRRWILPEAGAVWQEWEVPFDTDPDWPLPLQQALEAYRKAWRGKRDTVDGAIAARADQKELVDKPEIVRGKLRVSGPFTVEGVIPAEDWQSLQDPDDLAEDSPIVGAPEALAGTFGDSVAPLMEASQNAEAYLDKMLRLFKEDGVRFPDNKVIQLCNIEPLCDGGPIHARAVWDAGGNDRQVAVVIGPQYGPVTARQVEECLRSANRRGFNDLIIAGFSFDGAAQALIDGDPNPNVRCHLAHISPDVTMTDLLKQAPGAHNQIFTISGLPRAAAKQDAEGNWVVTMEGVDIYDPMTGRLVSTGADKVAAWFLDGDYDGGAFCITQAFFPDKSAWDKLARALGSSIDAERFAALSGTVSLPFPAGAHKRAAVKVIDPRGNEVMKILRLGTEVRYGA